MNRNSFSRSRRRRRRIDWKRLSIAAAVLVAIIGIIVLIVCLSTGEKEDKTADMPNIAPAVSATPEPVTTPEPITNPITEPETQPEAQPDEPSGDASATTVGDIVADGDTEEDPEAPIPPMEDQVVYEDPVIPEVADVPSTPTGSGRSAHIRVIGDVMFHQEQLDAARQPDGSYDFTLQFQFIAPSLRNADYTIANLETTVGKYKDTNYSGYPQFNTPESVLTTLQNDCGIDFFTLANNHMLDRWYDGMVNDVNLMEKYGFDYVGAYRSKEERNTPVIYEVNGIKIGFVAYTHSTNTMENYSDKAAKEYGVPYLYKSDIKADVQRLKDAGAEVIIALPHWGTENTHIPDSDQKAYAKKLAAYGVDIILGSHSHMVEPMLIVEGTDSEGKPRQVFCIYSMGNFISAMTMKRTDNGIILDFTIVEQPDGTFRVENVGYVPVYVWKHAGKYTVLPILKYTGDNRPDAMTDDQYNRMVESYHELTEVLGTEEFTVLPE